MTSVLATKKMERLPHSSGTTAKLAVESKRMEDRLRMLKQMMSAEKARREAEGGIHWQSGAQQQQQQQPQQQQEGRSGITSGTKKAGRSTKKPLRVKVLTDSSSLSSRAQLPRCGQCEKTTATLRCVECSEKYCQLCFAKFHQKGALSQHHVKPLLSKKNPQRSQIRPKANVAVEVSQSNTTSKARLATMPSSDQVVNSGVTLEQPSASVGESGSLLEGSYNEEESAASFQQALAEWRTGTVTNTDNTSKGVERQTKEMASLWTSTATQAGTGGITAGAGRRRRRVKGNVNSEDIGVHFSNMTGVSYFEKLVMRRHRYDPLYLAKSPAMNDTTTSANISTEIEDEVSFATNERDSSEDTLSEYNLFYCNDEDDEIYHHLAEEQPHDIVEFYRPTSSVQIREETFSQTQPNSDPTAALVEAKPEAVKVQLGEIEQYESTVTVGEAGASMEQKVQQRKQTISAKKRSTKQSGVSTYTSTDGRRSRNTKTKTKQPRKVSASLKPETGGSSSGGDGVAATERDTTNCKSQEPESNIDAAVKSAWSQSYKQPQLSNFFFQGAHQTAPLEESDTIDSSEVKTVVEEKSGEFQLAASIWLPGNSTVEDMQNETEQELKLGEIDPLTDVPPVLSTLTTNVQQPVREVSVMNTSSNASDSDSDTTDEIFQLDGRQSRSCTTPNVVCDLEEGEGEREERDQEDHDALESLAWELASTVECEGRLTRCESELDDSIEYRMSTPLLVAGHDSDDDVMLGMMDSVDLNRVMSDFELYQQEAMEYDSN